MESAFRKKILVKIPVKKASDYERALTLSDAQLMAAQRLELTPVAANIIQSNGAPSRLGDELIGPDDA